MKKYIIILFVFVSILSCKNYKNDENIVISLGGEVATIDPHLNTANIGTVYIRHFFEGLMKKDKDGKIIPGIAERYEMSDDGLVYTFYLRTNAKWSDGNNFTADDFLYSYRRFVDPKTAAPYGHLMKPIKNALKITKGEIPVEELGIKKVDDYTLEITLENPTAYFLELADMYLPVRKDIIEEYGNTWVLNPESYICNGPYKMKERIIDDKIVMEINTNYYDYDKLVAKNITIKMISDRNTALAGVRNGDIHFSNLVPPQEVEELRKEKLIVMNQAYGTVFFEINLTNKAFTDSRVRKALALAIDRNYLVNTVNKSGEIPAGAFVPPLIDDYEGKFRQNGGDYLSVDINDYQKNIEEAKRLMAEAGYPNGENYPVVEVLVSSEGNVVMVEAIQQMWKNIGVDAIIMPREWAVILQSFRDLSYQMVLSGWTGDYNDPMTMLDLYLSYAPSNPGYSNFVYDNLLEEAQKTVNAKDRMQILHKAEEILMNDMPIIPLHYRSNPLMISKRLMDYKLDPLSKYRFHYSYLIK
ncbi:peptide ABC transporter substrate-binding protein [uncultured Brachyspira sp.]|uniref:peptide ABC transporter substrate-binding protein n=1 Tax=uncultured Brachyspira sp. TaxID=221953 RepID=UPI00259B537B|nr:peptide ABC transporter substrate-binding protein [uncultured Brachyspira sp.]